MKEFVVLRPKMYVYLTDDTVIEKKNQYLLIGNTLYLLLNHTLLIQKMVD